MSTEELVAALAAMHQPLAVRQFCAECGQQIDEDGDCPTMRVAKGKDVPAFVPSGM